MGLEHMPPQQNPPGATPLALGPDGPSIRLPDTCSGLPGRTADPLISPGSSPMGVSWSVWV